MVEDYEQLELAFVQRTVRELIPGDAKTLSPTEVAEILGLSRSNVYTLMNEGKIKALLFGGRYRIPRWSLEQAIMDARDKAIG